MDGLESGEVKDIGEGYEGVSCWHSDGPKWTAQSVYWDGGR